LRQAELLAPRLDAVGRQDYPVPVQVAAAA